MKIKILWVGKTKKKELASLIDDYKKRIITLCPFEIIEIHEEKNYPKLPEKDALGREGKKIVEKMGEKSAFITLDDKGKSLTSLELAKKISEWATSHREIIFLVGSHYGLAKPIREKAIFSFSLSRMTFTHEMARLILLEQIFRALTIIRNIPYHK